MDNETRIEHGSASPVTDPPSDPSKSLWKTFAPLLIVVVLAIATLGAYYNTLDLPFVYDDLHLIRDNPLIVENRVEEIFTTDYWHGWQRGLITSQRLYRPLTMWSYALNYEMSSSEGQGRSVFTNWFHWTNLALHFLTVLLVYGVGYHLFRKRRLLAAGAALLFAVHPIHTEAVTRITGRADILAGLFVFLAWWLYIHATRHSEKARPVWATGLLWAGVLISFFLGLLSKEITVVFLPIIILYDLVVRNVVEQKLSFGRAIADLFSRRFLGYAAIFGILVITVGIRTKVFMDMTAVTFPEEASLSEKLGIVMDHMAPKVSDIAPLDNALIGHSFTERIDEVLHILGYQIGLLVFPMKLSADYSYQQFPVSDSLISSSALPWALAAIAVFLAGIALLVLRGQRANVGFLILFFFVALFPVSNLFLLIGTNLGERNLYIASASICWGLAWLFMTLWDRRRSLRYAAVAGLVIVAGLYTTRTVIRNEDYSSERRLWIATVETAPNAPRAHLNLADVYMRSGELTQAEEHAAKASELMPEYFRADLILGDINMRRGQIEDAIVYYRRLLDKLGERISFPDGPQAMTRLAQAYIQLGAFEEGAEELRTMAKNEDWRRLFANMEAAMILSEQANQTGRLGLFEDARELLEDASKMKMQDGGENARAKEAELYAMLGHTYRQLDMDGRAMQAYQHALELNDDLVLPALDLAACFIEKKKYSQALTWVERAIDLQPTLPKAYLVKADIYEGWDDFETALKCYQDALKHGQNQRDPRLLYQIGHAFLRWANRFEHSDDPMKRSRHKEMYEKAKEVLTQGSDLDPDNLKPKLSIAEAYYELGQLDEAIDAYRGLLSRGAPLAHRFHRRLGDLYADLGELEQAEEHYLTAIDLNPRGRNPHLAYLTFLKNQGRLDEAREILDFLTANNRPSEPDPVVEWVHETFFESHEFAQFLADFYYETGEYETADLWIKKVLQIAENLAADPDSRELGIQVGCDAVYRWGQSFLEVPEGSDRYAPMEALLRAKDALRKSAGHRVPNRPYYRVLFAKAALVADEPRALGDAMKLIKEAKDLLPDHPEIPEIQTQLKEKIRELQKAAQERPSDESDDDGAEPGVTPNGGRK